MAHTGACYFLIYRVRINEYIDFEEPTGGLEMACETIDGKPAPDYCLAFTLIAQRYHCGPNEALHMREAHEAEDQWTAHVLHRSWEKQQADFLELMAVE